MSWGRPRSNVFVRSSGKIIISYVIPEVVGGPEQNNPRSIKTQKKESSNELVNLKKTPDVVGAPKKNMPEGISGPKISPIPNDLEDSKKHQF